jgi:hypothetical protein
LGRGAVNQEGREMLGSLVQFGICFLQVLQIMGFERIVNLVQGGRSLLILPFGGKFLY